MRLAYLDVARGVALVLMVVNHTGRYWLAGTVESEPLIYLTTSGAGPPPRGAASPPSNACSRSPDRG